jgi:ABC-type multidrug transport system fused ATPase/permease subunit
LYLLDDPLSALDLKVGNYIMERTILQELADTTRIIITHAIQYTKHADRILVIDEGKIIDQGTYEEVQGCPLFQELKKQFENANNGIESQKETAIPTDKEKLVRKISKEDELVLMKNISGADNENEKEIQEIFFSEDREQGRVSFKVFMNVVGSMGGIWMFIAIFIMTGIFWGTSVFATNWLLEWSENFNCPEKWHNMTVYAILLVSRLIFVFIRTFTIFRVGVRTSRIVHAKMFHRIMHAQLHEFIDKVPFGRIINRFTSDIDIIDNGLFGRIQWSFLILTSLIASFVVVAMNSTYFTIVVVILFIA